MSTPFYKTDEYHIEIGRDINIYFDKNNYCCIKTNYYEFDLQNMLKIVCPVLAELGIKYDLSSISKKYAFKSQHRLDCVTFVFKVKEVPNFIKHFTEDLIN